MKLPSIQQLYLGLLNVIKRFPLQVVFSLIATICWCLYIHFSNNRSESEDLQDSLVKAILVSNLAWTLLLALDLFAEAHKLSAGRKWLLRMAGTAICAVLFFVLTPSESTADVYRMALLAFAFHLLVAFAPFIGRDNVAGFWEFNKSVFLRFLTSALYSVVLYAGLAIALVAVDGLFAADVSWKTYMMVFAVITAGFSTIFFLAGMPENISLVDENQDYPKGLKIFTQFVLIPLMSLYLAILLVYEIKILIVWELPKGLVSSLILGYAVFGILSLLLMHPIKATQGNTWIKLFSKFFYVMMIPLIILLMLAVWKRVSHYGITESRYILIVLAVWLAGITMYFLISKKDNIKLIPISLCILALLACYGPQSASSVSKNGQLSRLKSLMKSDKADDRSELPSVIRYLVATHGLETLQPLTKRNLHEITQRVDRKNTYRYTQKEAMIDTALSILKVSHDKNSGGLRVTFLNDENEILKVAGYDYLIEMNSYPQPRTFDFSGSMVTTNSSSQGGKLSVNVDDETILEVDLDKLFKEAALVYKEGGLKASKSKEKFYYPAKLMRFGATKGQFEYTVVVTSLQNTYYGAGGSSNGSWTESTSYLLIKKL